MMTDRISKSRRDFLLAAGSVPLLFVDGAQARSGFPAKTTTIVCGFQAGGIVDVTSRRVAQGLAGEWGTTVIVENRTGANANLAANAVAQAEPNGSTILVTLHDGLVISAAAKLDYGFDPLRDLTPVAVIGDVENWFLVPATSPYKTMQEFIEAGKKTPGSLNFGTTGIGSSGHLALEQINNQTGIGLVHVPYRGTSMLVDLMAGRIDAVSSSRLSNAGLVQGGKLRILAVTGARRSSLYPDIPTFADVGLGSVFVAFSLSAFVSAKTPQDIVSRLNRDINKVVNQPALRDQFANDGIPVSGVTPAEFKVRMLQEVGLVEDVIKRNNLQISRS